jgi:hypothetical protein
MRTSAPKNFSLFPRIAKEIPGEIDRASRAQNFTAIAMLRECALEAIARDRNFSVCARFRQAARESKRLDEKNF